MKGVLGTLCVAVAAALGLADGAAAQLPELPPLPEAELPTVPDDPSLPGVPETDPVPTLPLPGSGSGSGSGSTGGDGGGSTGGDGGGSTASGSGTSSSTSGSTSTRSTGSSGQASAGSSQTQRRPFERLPRRYDVLLQRILLGRDLAANLERLERLLASASPELRARIERLVRRELARLERGATTREERRRAERLRLVLRLLARTDPSGAAPGASTGSAAAVRVTRWPGERGASTLQGDAAPSPRSAASSGTASAGASEPPREGRSDGAESASPLPGVPSDIEIRTFLWILVAALLAVAAAAFSLASLPGRVIPAGRLRGLVESSRSDLAFLGLASLAVMMLLLFAAVLA